MTTNSEFKKNVQTVHRIQRQALQAHWKFFLALGVVLLLLGIAAAVLPNIASLAIELIVGWVLFVAGIFGIGSSLGARQAPGFRTIFLVSITATLAGGLLVLWPIQGVFTLTMALAAYFIAHGVGLLVMAYSVKLKTNRWFWLLVGALIDFTLAVLIIAGLPGTAAWILGLLVGVNLIFTGLGLIVAAAGTRFER